MCRALMKKCILSLLILSVAVFSSVWAMEPNTELTWYGHAAFKIVTPQGHVLWIDPWIANPLNPDGESDLAHVDRADLLLVSHGHFDHVGNAIDIAKKTQAKLVATFDLGNALIAYAGFPAAQAGYDSLGNLGGTLRFFNGEVAITFVPAMHSSALNPKDLGVADASNQPEYAGNPSGFLIVIQNGPTIYHTGDTDLFGDMALIPQHHSVDVMLTCMGGHFTMDPNGAAKAVAIVHPKRVIPMHYGTFPSVLPGTVDAFATALKQQKQKTILQPLTLEKPVRF